MCIILLSSQRLQNIDRLQSIDRSKKDEVHSKETSGVHPRKLRRWKEQEEKLRELPRYQLRGKMRIRQKGIGKFPAVENVLLKESKGEDKKQKLALKCGSNHGCASYAKNLNLRITIQNRINSQIDGSMVFLIGKNWACVFAQIKRNKLSGKRGQKVQNHHHRIIYSLRNEPISDTGSETSSEESETSAEESEISSE